MDKSGRLSTADTSNSRNYQYAVTASSIQSIKYSVGSSGQFTTASRKVETCDADGKRRKAHRVSNMFKGSNGKKQLVDGRFLIETGLDQVVLGEGLSSKVLLATDTW